MSNRIIPSLTVDDADAAIGFYDRVFGVEINNAMRKNGRILHAEIFVANTRMMIMRDMMGILTSDRQSRQPIVLYVYVRNVDSIFSKAVNAGARVEYPVKNSFYGDRVGVIIDPFNVVWNIATHRENLSNDEILRRFDTEMETESDSKSCRIGDSWNIHTMIQSLSLWRI